MDRGYGERYADLYRRHWWWRARERFVLDALARFPPPRANAEVLDIGCGDALLFDRLARFGPVRGIEPDGMLVRHDNPHRDRIEIRPFDEGYRPNVHFGLILMLDVLEHIEDHVAALRHAVRLLEPGGRLVLTVPALDVLWTAHDVLNHHFRRYDRAGFRAVAAAAGMRLDDLRYFFHWTCGPKLAMHAAERVAPRAPKSPTVPPALVNAIGYALSRMEQPISSRVAMPFGSSLLAVGGAA